MKEILRQIKRAARPGSWLWRGRKLVPYIAITLSGMLIVFFLIDRVNKPIAFMTNEFHKVITFVLALLSIGLSIRVICYHRESERLDWQRRMRRHARQADSQSGGAAARKNKA